MPFERWDPCVDHHLDTRALATNVLFYESMPTVAIPPVSFHRIETKVGIKLKKPPR